MEMRDRREGNSLYVKTSGHAHLLRALTGLSRAMTHRMVDGATDNSKFNPDPMALLDYWGGFRVNSLEKPYANGVGYIQVYHADKALAYSSSSTTKVVRLDAYQFLTSQNGSGRNVQNWCKDAVAALDIQKRRAIPNAVRIEIIVSLADIDHSVLWLSDRVLEKALVAMPTHLIPWVQHAQCRLAALMVVQDLPSNEARERGQSSELHWASRGGTPPPSPDPGPCCVPSLDRCLHVSHSHYGALWDRCGCCRCFRLAVHGQRFSIPSIPQGVHIRAVPVDQGELDSSRRTYSAGPECTAVSGHWYVCPVGATEGAGKEGSRAAGARGPGCTAPAAPAESEAGQHSRRVG